jgi:predicted metal-binding membrane protein
VTALRPRTLAIAALLALAAWIVTYERMRGMDAGPGTDLGTFGWFLGIWVTMMAAMMLPSAAPMLLLFDRVANERTRRGQGAVPTSVFFAGYLATWTAYGILAYGLYRLVAGLDPAFLAWERGGRWIAGAAIAGAGVYELTPLKSVCLRHCRSPLHYVLGGWRPGHLGAFRMGAEHGAYCVGCCWGLMIVLFALGVMSLTWMGVVAALVFAQKVLPIGGRLPYLFAAAFVAAGVWVASAPGSVPGLTEPDSPAAQQARMHMTNMQPGMQPGMSP